MDIEFNFKGDPIGGVITNCKYVLHVYSLRTFEHFTQCLYDDEQEMSAFRLQQQFLPQQHLHALVLVSVIADDVSCTVETVV